MKRVDVLENVEWAEGAFGSLISNSQIARRDIMRCVKAGLVKSVGLVTVCDGDGGALSPERFREGFKLTEAGRNALRGVSSSQGNANG